TFCVFRVFRGQFGLDATSSAHRCPETFHRVASCPMKPPSRHLLGLIIALVVTPLLLSQPADPKFDAIKAKHDRGEPVTPEERAYAQLVLAHRNQQNSAGRNTEYAKA